MTTTAKPPPGPALATFPLQEESHWRISILLVLSRTLHTKGRSVSAGSLPLAERSQFIRTSLRRAESIRPCQDY